MKYLSKAVAFSGPSNSGKTTLIQKLSNILSPNHKVVIIKHDPKDKAIFDVEGKDSHKFFESGADTVVLSPTRTTYFSHKRREVEEVIEALNFDYLLVEGLKEIELPRISIFRNELNKSYLPYSNAIAIDDTVQTTSDLKLDVLDLNNEKQILEWINKNAKVVK